MARQISLKQSTRKKILGYTMVLPFFVIVCATIGGVAIYSIVLSFKDVYLISSQSIGFVGFQTYKEIFTNSETIIVIKNSLKWVVTGTFFVILLGVAVGTLLSDDTNVFCRITRAVMLLPWILPGVVVAGVWKWMYHSQTGLINKYLVDFGFLKEGFPWLGMPKTALFSVTVVVIWRLFPLFSLIVVSAIQTIDTTLYEAGRVDGMNKWQEFIYITLPMIKYQVLAMGLLNMIWIMNNLVLINLMTQGGPLYFSENFPVYMYKLGFQYTKLSQASAVTMINFAILLAMCLVYVYTYRKIQKA
jgi:multiple sugar transport system permease protein